MPQQIQQDMSQPYLGGEVTQNAYQQPPAQQGQFTNPMMSQGGGDMGGAMGGGMPAGGMGDMGGLGGMMGNGDISKALGTAAQMGLIPGSGGAGGAGGAGLGGFSMPKFGQKPVQRSMPMQQQRKPMPGAGMARSVNGAVNYGVKAGAYRAINRGLSRALRF